MNRDTVDPTLDDYGHDTHPAYGMIAANRVSSSPPGAILFDSEIRHRDYVVLRISHATRKRDLHHDRVHEQGHGDVVEVAMSEAQWASFVSSMNTSGVPCTLRRTQADGDVPDLPFDSRLEQSHAEVRDAADKALADIKAALAAYEAHKTVRNLRTLHYTIENAPSNMAFAAKSLTEHAETVVTKARADIEAMVVSKAQQVGLDAADVAYIGQLTTGRDTNPTDG